MEKPKLLLVLHTLKKTKTTPKWLESRGFQYSPLRPLSDICILLFIKPDSIQGRYPLTLLVQQGIKFPVS